MSLIITAIAYTMVVLAIYLIADGLAQAVVQIWKNLTATGKLADEKEEEKFNPPI